MAQRGNNTLYTVLAIGGLGLLVYLGIKKGRDALDIKVRPLPASTRFGAINLQRQAIDAKMPVELFNPTNSRYNVSSITGTFSFDKEDAGDVLYTTPFTLEPLSRKVIELPVSLRLSVVAPTIIREGINVFSKTQRPPVRLTFNGILRAEGMYTRIEFSQPLSFS